MTLALDLFCGAGGASVGLYLAGFDVVGVDIEPQPHYPPFIEFVLTDVLACDPKWVGSFDLVWASPPCQSFTAYRRRPKHVRPALNLIPQTRSLLEQSRVECYIIENIPGAKAHLINPVQLCGSSFGLDVRRHRLFECCGFNPAAPPCNHAWQTPRFPPATNRRNLRCTVEVGVGVYRIPLQAQQRAMGIDWMQLGELSQAIPPAYAEHLGRQAMNSLGKRL